MVLQIKMWRCREASGFWVCFKGGVEKARVLMGFTVLEEPVDGGGKVEGDSFRFPLPLRCLQDRTVEMMHALSAYMSPQVLLPPALCLPRGSWLEGEAHAGPR